MYIPKQYQETNPKVLNEFIRQNNFGILISQQNGLPIATHLPLTLMVDENDTRRLYGHVSRANPQWKSFNETDSVLVIFGGPHAYISPRWYNHLNVPTWNYMAVHAYGKVRLVTETNELRLMMKLLINQHEAQPNKTQTYTLETLPDDYVEKQLNGITGFEIKIEQIEASFKLSQNRDEESYQTIIQELQKQDETAQQVAKAMQHNYDKLFKP